ncbi:sigma-54-dependent transcriptional regulator [Hydrogenophaga electricum]|uniref:Sigma-54-dependent Fis family transcriptional regulator n=1 Tax=Hydrogenophaga electricum TaxID=1230953 RepID=A0ABQ6C9B1_9BURK|nr:sigma-54 dependent transcriptional regulator [Hydrogenophaga electricum]GLS16237.1 sigma-54-dependent Fis family transcriptional regulator [Hydrogenophaga electricum]
MTNAPASGLPVLLIEDDPVLGGALVQRLRLEGFRVEWATTCADALQAMRRARPAFVLSDIRLPDGSGEDLYRQAQPYLGDTPIVFATAFADIGQAVRLVRAGADDYLTKPCDADELVRRIRELASPPAAAAATPTEGFGLSAVTERLAADLRRLAPRDVPVLLRGETGVGKEVAARQLHALSPRAEAPFVAVNCGAIPPELMESQFFGHERGAFTGAHGAHIGFFEEAGTGTLFLDEIGELDPRLQATLLRVLQDGVFRRVGARQDQRFQGRIVAATNADLAERMRAGRFREDLYFRLAVVELPIPPLRERPAEILALAQPFMAQAAERQGLPCPTLSPLAHSALLAHAWPGNVRELRNRIERAVALCDTPVLDAGDLFPERALDPPDVAGDTLANAREQAELAQIERALELSGGRLTEAAQRLGVSRTTLWKRRKRLGGNPDDA